MPQTLIETLATTPQPRSAPYLSSGGAFLEHQADIVARCAIERTHTLCRVHCLLRTVSSMFFPGRALTSTISRP